MKNLSMIFAALLTIVFFLPVLPTHAGQMSVPGGWSIDVVYCTNGFEATLVVPASITADTTHSAFITSVSIPAALNGGEIATFYSADGVGGFTVSKVFYWLAPQAVGTPVTASSERYEDALQLPANNDDNDFVGNCAVPEPPVVPVDSFAADGRINPQAWATGAIYCRADAVEVLYSIDGDPREGQQAMYVLYSAIDAAAADTLLASTTDGYYLYKLSDGSLVLNAPELDPVKRYIFHWDGC